MKKNIQLLTSWKDYEAGTVIELDSATADALILAETAKEWSEADEASKKAADAQAKAAQDNINKTIKDAISTHFEELAKSVDGLGSGLHITVDPSQKEELPYKSIGAQLLDVKTFTLENGGDAKELAGNRLAAVAKAATGSSELVDADGGFLVQQDFMTQLDRRAVDSGILASRVDTREVAGNGLKWNELDDYDRRKGNHAVTTYWLEEAGTKTASKPTFIRRSMELEKLIGMYYSTDELLEDAPALAGEVSQWFGEEFGFQLDDAIYDGTGGGKPRGILQSNALVSVAKETSQTADTVVAENVVKMFARMPARYLAGAAWIVNQDVLPQLPLMKISDQPVYLPPNGLIDAPAGMLLGKPIIVSEHAKTVGDKGDIMFANLAQYKLIRKGGIKGASSIHVRFVNDETAFRWVMRTNGDTKWSKSMTPTNGSNNLSPFVSLDARA